MKSIQYISNSCSNEYRFGFNGQEKTDEVSGVGNHLDYKYRGYDPQTGRFWSVDPLFKDYPWNSTYCFAENDVIRAIDLEGAERNITIDGSKINGPFILEKINDNIVKQNGVVTTEKLLGANAKIMAQKLNQKFYKTPDLYAKPKPLFEVKSGINFKVGASLTTKVLGYGMQGDIGVTQPIISSNYSDLGMSRETFGNASADIGAGLCGAGYGASYDINKNNLSVNGNLGPVYGAHDGSNLETNTNLIDIKAGFLLEAYLKIDFNFFDEANGKIPEIKQPDLNLKPSYVNDNTHKSPTILPIK